jgi:class I fructose-bisphosphate aldolase
LSHSQQRSVLDALDLGVGKRTRLLRLFSGGGALLLRVDQGLEQGPIAFADAPSAADPAAALDMAAQGSFSGVILQIGMAERYPRGLAGRVPLVLKLNGKSAIPPEDEALAPLNATVEDALRLGADAVAYTLYAGTPAQFEDFTQFSQVRQDCTRYGMPLLVLAQPRGAAIERKGGPDGLYAIEYAARIAAELGADVVALDPPAINAQRDAQAPKPYNTVQLSAQEALHRVIAAAGRMPVLVGSDGATGEAMAARAREAREAGAAGLIYGHTFWQRPREEALAVAGQLRALLG